MERPLFSLKNNDTDRRAALLLQAARLRELAGRYRLIGQDRAAAQAEARAEALETLVGTVT